MEIPKKKINVKAMDLLTTRESKMLIETLMKIKNFDFLIDVQIKTSEVD
jgi:hypothetical protein